MKDENDYCSKNIIQLYGHRLSRKQYRNIDDERHYNRIVSNAICELNANAPDEDVEDNWDEIEIQDREFKNSIYVVCRGKNIYGMNFVKNRVKFYKIRPKRKLDIFNFYNSNNVNSLIKAINDNEWRSIDKLTKNIIIGKI